MEEDITWKDVLSSRVQRVGYSPSAQALYVAWAKGAKVSRYSDVPPDVADEFTKSWSVGEAVNSMLAGRYEMTYV